ncbi:MAG: ferritin [Bacillota bacterium]|nr:ferritin [Bacillota bacterium]MDW7730192.1 ferritin [Bacillota bacterium]
MLSDKLLEKLNEQITHEFFSAHYYLAMAAHFKKEDLDGFANFFIVQAEEERFHAMKFFEFINDQGNDAVITGFKDPKRNFESAEEIFALALEHEKLVSSLINDLMALAQEEKHYPSISFLQWFIDEQVEEEASMSKMLNQIRRIGEQGHGIIMLDRELAMRTFTPAAE